MTNEKFQAHLKLFNEFGMNYIRVLSEQMADEFMEKLNMRTCVICEVEKDVMEFYDMSDGNEYFQPVCKRCRYDNLGPEVKTIQEQDDYFKTFSKFEEQASSTFYLPGKL